MADKVSLNIALVTGSAPPMPCGVGDNTLMMARALAHRGHKVTVYTHYDAAEVHEHNLDVRPIVPDWGWAGCHALTLALTLDDPDLVHLAYPTRGYKRGTGPGLIPTFLRVRRYRGPIITHLHEFTAANAWRRTVIWPMLNESDEIIVPDVRERAALLFKHRSLGDRRVDAIPSGPVIWEDDQPAATPEEWQAFLRANDIPADASPVILSYGFARKDKGMAVLATALAEIAKKSKAHVLHLGPWDPASDPQQEAIAQDISNILVKDHGRFHFASRVIPGYQPLRILPREVPANTIAVFPYTDGISDRRSAAITLGILGYPIIATRAPGVDLGWEDLATLVPANDPSALAAAILSGNAPPQRARFEERFNWQRLAGLVEESYHDALDRYRALTDPGYVPEAAAATAGGGGHH